MKAHRLLTTAMGLFGLALGTFAHETAARADEESDVETADGSRECREFREKNESELADWEKEQPPVPYRYPREQLLLGAPWSQFFKTMGHSGELVIATLVPHIGAQFRGDAPAAQVAWPWTILAFGPATSCSRKRGTFVVHGHKAHRLMFEPALVSSTRGVGLSFRPAYRFVWHPTSWVVGPGIGLGSTIEVAGNREPFRYSVSPELVAHFGHCCRSSYFTFALRYDHFFGGNIRDIIGGSLGYTFF